MAASTRYLNSKEALMNAERLAARAQRERGELKRYLLEVSTSLRILAALRKEQETNA